MSTPHSDEQLDRLLRQVRAPSGLHARLAAIVDEVDSLEQELRAVPVPGGMHERLSAVVADERVAELEAKAEEAAFDARLRNVAIPRGLHVRLRSLAQRRPLAVNRLLTIAAMLLVLAGWEGALFFAYYASLLDDSPQPPSYVAAGVVDPAPIRQRLDGLQVPRPVDPDSDRKRSSSATATASLPLPSFQEPIDVQFAKVHEIERHRNSVERSRRQDMFQFASWATGAVADGETEVLGASPRAALPDAVRFAARKPRGIDALLNAVDRKFLLDYGVFPLVSSREFPTSIVPFAYDTSGFEATRAALADGQWPTLDAARPEEFLAAIDFGYGKPNDKAARLYAAGAIAPWAPAPTMPPPNGVGAPVPVAPERIGRLLQLSVQARELPAAARKPMRLTVAVDATESMRAGSKLTLVKRALKILVDRLQPNDRLTLVALGGTNPVVIEEAGRAELDQLYAAVESLRAEGGGSLAEGIAKGIVVAARREPPKQVEQRLVVISDGFDECSVDDVYNVEQLLKAPATRTLGLDLIDLRQSAGFGQPADATAWDALTLRRSGRVARADTVERIRSALLESLTGLAQTVARNATLTVTFNPATVVAYRLIGHEPTAVAGLPPRSVEIDLAAGQTGTWLYELQLNGGKDPLAATAVLRWTDPATGTAQEATQAITRGTLGPAFDKAAPQLQLATIAAAAAARLRNSPWGDNVAPDEVLQWALRLERAGTLRGVGMWRELVLQIQRLPNRRTPSKGNR